MSKVDEEGMDITKVMQSRWFSEFEMKRNQKIDELT